MVAYKGVQVRGMGVGVEQSYGSILICHNLDPLNLTPLQTLS